MDAQALSRAYNETAKEVLLKRRASEGNLESLLCSLLSSARKAH